MDMKQWLEEAMVMINMSFRLMPSGVFHQCLESCREQDVSLVAIAGVCNQLGLVDEKKLLELKERFPEPSKTPPQPDDVVAARQMYRREIERYRFWMNYFIGVAKEIPVVIDLQVADQKADEYIKGTIRNLVGEVMKSNKEARRRDKDGKSDTNPA